MQVDKVTQVIEEEEAASANAQESSSRFLFTVKIVLAEGLVPSNRDPSSKLDTFVTLSDQHGFRLAKTRTVYESLDPRCKSHFEWGGGFPSHRQRSYPCLLATPREPNV